MDFNYFDPTNPAHMELVNMMMQMENVPEFSEMTPASVLDFSGGSGTPPPYYGPNSSQFGGGSPIAHQICQPQYSSDGMVNPSVGPDKRASMAAMREMIFRIAAMQPVHIDPEVVKPPKRRNVKISKDPQSVAARHRRERISERIRILQLLVPGGTKMDTASMLDEAIHYVKFLKSQVQSLEWVAANRNSSVAGMGSAAGSSSSGNYPYFDSDMYYDQMLR